MKTTIKAKMALLAIFTLLLSFVPETASAQLPTGPYTINNNLPTCKVYVRWVLYDNTCTNVCNTGGGTIAPGGNLVVTVADFNSGTCGGNVCDIDVILYQINGTNVGPIIANSSTPNPPVPVVGSCNGAGSIMAWSPTNCDINP